MSVGANAPWLVSTAVRSERAMQHSAPFFSTITLVRHNPSDFIREAVSAIHVHSFFLAWPVWVLASILYLVFAALAGAAGRLPELPEEETAIAAPAEQAARPGRRSRAYLYFGGLGVLCLFSIILFSYCVFAGYMRRDAVMLRIGPYDVGFERYLTIATAIYFISGVIWRRGREKRKAQAAA